METSVKIKNNNNNKKIYETSLPTSMINKKNEMRKYKSNAPQLKQSQTDPKQLIDYILSIMI
jgi:hypothetical protein